MPERVTKGAREEPVPYRQQKPGRAAFSGGGFALTQQQGQVMLLSHHPLEFPKRFPFDACAILETGRQTASFSAYN